MKSFTKKSDFTVNLLHTVTVSGQQLVVVVGLIFQLTRGIAPMTV